jgi:hypothetical protein
MKGEPSPPELINRLVASPDLKPRGGDRRRFSKTSALSGMGPAVRIPSPLG